MKLTKAKLQKIIKEELAEITEPSYRFAPKADPRYKQYVDKPEDRDWPEDANERVAELEAKVKELDDDRNELWQAIADAAGSTQDKNTSRKLYDLIPEEYEAGDDYFG